MNYPVWYLPQVGGGVLIATIAVLHVFISHFAVGGGFYLLAAERKGLREQSPEILSFTKAHARFFLLITAVLGGITGVGIWFIISLVNPAATSILIHTFVFGWATEWVFFLVEILAIFVYYYTFGRLNPRTHQKVGVVYCVAAWLSLFIINGIIDFMLTPGSWTTTNNFWDGFFNPGFWPSLFFRTCVALLFAGVYAFLTTAFLDEDRLKVTMTRFSGKWVFASLAAAIPFGFWYLSILPELPRTLVGGVSPTIHAAVRIGIVALALLLLLTLVLVIIRPALHTKPVSFAIFISALLIMGSFEWTREAARRPFVIHGVMYSTSVPVAELERVSSKGFLIHARWARVNDAGDQLKAGAELFKFQCYACHSLGGFNNDLIRRTAVMDFASFLPYLQNVHQIRPFMPPFAGNEEERKALAAYLLTGIHGKMETPPVTVQNGRGAEIFTSRCTICHPQELVVARTAGWPLKKIRTALDNLSRLNAAMPDFDGTPAEKDELAAHIASLQAGKGGER